MTGRTLSILLLLLSATNITAAESNWPRFRGPDGGGISDATTVPVEWTEGDYNWKVKLPGVGHGSPVVWGNRIYLTCGDPETAGRIVLCINTVDGKTLWRRDYPSTDFKQHRDNVYASATPTADADGVVVTWTTPGAVVLLALDPAGRRIWRRDLGPFVAMHGSGTSPIIVGDLIVLANDQEDPAMMARILGREGPTDPSGKSFLIAVDRKSGKTRWQIPRRTALAAYSTPCVRRTKRGTVELIFTSTAHGLTAVDASSGKVAWEVPDVFLDRCIGSPVATSGLVLGGFGYGARGNRYVAVRPESRADDSKPAIAYDVTQAVPLVPTPLIHGDRLYLWGDDGVATCMKVATGDTVWRERIGGSFYGSPVWVDERLYGIAKDGQVVVVAASDDFEVLGRMPLGEPSYSTPAVAAGVMYLRTRSQLFSIGGKKPSK